jgi:hypothetical protein
MKAQSAKSMINYVIFRRGAWSSPEEVERAASRSTRAGQEMADRVRWIRSYVVHEPDGRLGSVCIYQATDPETAREHARCSAMPADEVIPFVKTVVINDDPVAAA